MLAITLLEVLDRSPGNDAPYPFVYGFDSSVADKLYPFALQASDVARFIQTDSRRIIEDSLLRTSIGLWTWDCRLGEFTVFMNDRSISGIRGTSDITLSSLPLPLRQSFVSTTRDMIDEHIGELPSLLDVKLACLNEPTKIPCDKMAIEARVVFDFGIDPLLPHTDSGRKLFSIILPLTLPDEHLESRVEGTSILKPRIPGLTSNKSKRYPRILFKRIMETEHEIGHFLAFRKTNNSWHAVYPQRKPRSKPRISLLINIVKNEK